MSNRQLESSEVNEVHTPVTIEVERCTTHVGNGVTRSACAIGPESEVVKVNYKIAVNVAVTWKRAFEVAGRALALVGSTNRLAVIGCSVINTYTYCETARSENGTALVVNGHARRRLRAKVDTVQHGIAVGVTLVGDAASADTRFYFVRVQRAPIIATNHAVPVRVAIARQPATENGAPNKRTIRFLYTDEKY